MKPCSESKKTELAKATETFQGSLDEATWAFLLGRGFSEDMVHTYGLGLVSAEAGETYAPYVGRLSIPFTTPTGVVALRFRCLEDHDCKDVGCPKYLQMGQDPDRIYNVGALHERHPAIAICEGEIDAMFVDTHVMPAVGVPGATKWKPHWTRLFEDYDRVFVIGDGDSAGRKFCEKLTDLLPNGKPVIMPPDTDANSFLVEQGPEALSAYILGGQ